MLTLGGGSQGQATVNRKRLLSGWLFVLGTTLLNGALDLMIVIVYHGYVRQQFGKDSQQDTEYFQLLWFEVSHKIFLPKLGCSVGMFICALITMCGARKEKRCLLLAWVVAAGIVSVLNALSLCDTIGKFGLNGVNTYRLFGNIIVLVINLYFVIHIVACYREIGARSLQGEVNNVFVSNSEVFQDFLYQHYARPVPPRSRATPPPATFTQIIYAGPPPDYDSAVAQGYGQNHSTPAQSEQMSPPSYSQVMQRES